MARWTWQELMAALGKVHGKPAAPPRDPWRLVLTENVAYLADDERRAQAFALLEKSVGLAPAAIAKASEARLMAVARHGILAETFAEKLRKCAQIALELAPDSDGDLRPLLEWPYAKAKRALKRFPGIGDPGADKILLFARAHARPALESNGLRVLTRLGLAPEQSSYATTYKRAIERVASLAPEDLDGLIRAHLLLRRHGQLVCKNKRPDCDGCALRQRCDFALAQL